MNLFFISLVISLFIQPATQSFADDEDYATYKNDWYGFSYQFPKDWSYNQYDMGDFGISYENFHDQYMDNANDLHASVSIINTESNISTEVYYAAQKEKISDDKGYVFYGEGTEVIDGKTFYWITFTRPEDSLGYLENTFSVYMYCADTRCYAFILQLDQYVTSKELEVLGNIVYSIRIYEPYDDQRKRDWNNFSDNYQYGHLDVTQRMLDEGYSLNDMNEEGKTRLELALSEAYFDNTYDPFLLYVLDNGADVNQVDLTNGETPIFKISQGGTKYFQLLVDHGADLKIENYKEQTVYQKMKDAYRDGDAKFLKSLGAK